MQDILEYRQTESVFPVLVNTCQEVQQVVELPHVIFVWGREAGIFFQKGEERHVERQRHFVVDVACQGHVGEVQVRRGLYALEELAGGQHQHVAGFQAEGAEVYLYLRRAPVDEQEGEMLQLL